MKKIFCLALLMLSLYGCCCFFPHGGGGGRGGSRGHGYSHSYRR